MVIAILLAESWARSMIAFVRSLGSIGLLIMGVLDSSFLFLPFGNDLLLILMVSSARDSYKWILYVVMSTLGSVIGVLLIDLVSRKMGEESLERFVKPDKLKRLKAKIEEKGGWAVFIATLIPPPFPFTAVVITASVLQCSRAKVLVAVLFGRLLRFTIEAMLALYFGRHLLRLMDSQIIDYFVYSFIVVAIIGSIFSIRKWLSGRQERSSIQTSESQ
jgi:membrane protein YqaA with SNARE-associated domain